MAATLIMVWACSSDAKSGILLSGHTVSQRLFPVELMGFRPCAQLKQDRKLLKYGHFGQGTDDRGSPAGILVDDRREATSLGQISPREDCARGEPGDREHDQHIG